MPIIILYNMYTALELVNEVRSIVTGIISNFNNKLLM